MGNVCCWLLSKQTPNFPRSSKALATQLNVEDDLKATHKATSHSYDFVSVFNSQYFFFPYRFIDNENQNKVCCSCLLVVSFFLLFDFRRSQNSKSVCHWLESKALFNENSSSWNGWRLRGKIHTRERNIDRQAAHSKRNEKRGNSTSRNSAHEDSPSRREKCCETEKK